MQNPNGPTGAFGTTTNMPGAPVQNGRDPEDPVQVADGPFLTASDGTIMLGAPTDSADALNRATDCTLTSITFALTPIGSACAATDLTNPRTFCKSRCYRLLQGTPAFMQCLSAVGMETMAQPLLAALTGCEAGH